mgnify:CR=1 FL=1
MTRSRSSLVYWVLGLTAVGALAVCVLRDDCTLLTPDQRAFRHYEAEDYEAAAEEFSDPMWRGVALYRAGRYTEASEAFEGVERDEVKADALYNLGNTRYKLSDFDGAVDAYEESLAMRADDEDTLHNLTLAKRMLEQSLTEEIPEEEEPEEPEEEEEQQEEEEQESEEQEQEFEGVVATPP